MILGIQIIGLLFGIFLLYLSFINFKRKEFSNGEWIFWTVVWLLFIIVTIMPSILDSVVKTLSLTRTMDFFTIVGFLFLIVLGFNNHRLVKKNNKKVEEIVRKIAFKNCEVNETETNKLNDEERK